MRRTTRSIVVKSTSSFREEVKSPISSRPKTGEAVAESEVGGSLGRHLYELCSEVAGAIIRRNLSEDDSRGIRAEIRAGLVEHIDCSINRAESVIDLSLELIHVKAYGKFARNDLELALLIAKAGGQFRDGSLN